MAKIFTSYKHKDTEVRPIEGVHNTTARDYVDLLNDCLEELGHINKSEASDEDISHLSEDTIRQKLNDKIYDSTITIVLISKNMKEEKSERNQWIPREISYSLTENNRGGRTSHTNAVLAVVIPDDTYDYGYLVENNPCNSCSSVTWKHGELFNILSKNMFNRNVKKKDQCTNGVCGSTFHRDNDHSYIHLVTWDNFINDMNWYINLSTEIKENISDYDVQKEIARPTASS